MYRKKHLWAELPDPKHGRKERCEHMKRWDGLVESYGRWCESRGLSEATIGHRRNELDRWGCWLKRSRPRLNLEEVRGPLLIQYIKRRTAFRSKATVVGVVSVMRCLGEYLVQL